MKRWYQTRFSDPDAVTLFLLLVFCFAVIWLFGDLLAPLLVALVMAICWVAGESPATGRPLAPSPPAWSCCCSSR